MDKSNPCKDCYRYLYCYGCANWITCKKDIPIENRPDCFQCDDEDCELSVQNFVDVSEERK